MRTLPSAEKIKCNGIKPAKSDVYTLAAELVSMDVEIKTFKQAIVSSLQSYDYHDYYYDDYYECDYYYYDYYYYDYYGYDYHNHHHDYYYYRDDYTQEEKVITLLFLAAIHSQE